MEKKMMKNDGDYNTLYVGKHVLHFLEISTWTRVEKKKMMKNDGDYNT